MSKIIERPMTAMDAFEMIMGGDADNLRLSIKEGWIFIKILKYKKAMDKFIITIDPSIDKMHFKKLKSK